MIKVDNIYILFFLTGINFFLNGQDIRIIPQPSKVIPKSGNFVLKNKINLYANSLKLHKLIGYSETMFKDDWKVDIEVSDKSKATLSLIIDTNFEDQTLGAYELFVANEGIVIRSSSEKGLFYGLQTLRQLIKPNKSIPQVEIYDAPRFGWRAFMLDEGRHFKGKKQVKMLIEEMARLKMNVFHWHLVDDQGWRIQIKKYPLLTQVGAKRKSTPVGWWKSPIQSAEQHQGFYTQDEIKEIILYASERHITIVPEIEMPAHSSSAIASYPWLGASKKRIEVPIKFGVLSNIYDVADDKVYQFLTDVLDEVIELFPSPVIHIGGDEAKYDDWKKSEKINGYMQKNGLKNYADLQVYFINRISKYLNSKGKRMMGWNEILGQKVHKYQMETEKVQEKVAEKTIVHFWKGDKEMIVKAVTKGYDVVNSTNSETYLDHRYSKIPLSRAYRFNPIPKELPSQLDQKIIGLGCQMWGEWVPTDGQMHFMVFPRIAAYAEVGWTKVENKDFDEFKKQLLRLQEIWKDKGIYFAPMEYSDPIEKEKR